MDLLEEIMLRIDALKPGIPFWAKAEGMEICTPQKELWRYADDCRTARMDAELKSLIRETGMR